MNTYVSNKIEMFSPDDVQINAHTHTYVFSYSMVTLQLGTSKK